MNALAVTVDWRAVPESVRSFASPGQTAITPGKRYGVAGVAAYKAITFLLIVDDQGEPSLVPAWFFRVDTGAVPQGWVCAIGLGGGVDVVMGPDFVARDLDAYASVVDHAPEVMDAVLRYNAAEDPGGVADERPPYPVCAPSPDRPPASTYPRARMPGRLPRGGIRSPRSHVDRG